MSGSSDCSFVSIPLSLLLLLVALDDFAATYQALGQQATPTAAMLSSSYQPGMGFDLGCRVYGKPLVEVSGPTGTVDFNDLTEDRDIGSAVLSSPSRSIAEPVTTTITAFKPSSALVAGDFNGDGFADLAFGVSGESAVEVLIGKGDGTFQTPVRVEIGNAVRDIVIGDFNNDGNLDLTASAVDQNGDGTLSILLGDGKGGFSLSDSYSTTGLMVASDFNIDGNLDIAIFNGNGGPIDLFLGKGDGTFTELHAVAVGGASSSRFVEADFNHDSKPDLAFPDGTILMGNEDGTFRAGRNLDSVMWRPTGGSVITGDFNGDGNPDLAFGVIGSGDQAQSGVGVYLGKGDGSFTALPPFGEVPDEIIAGDFSGSGHIDVVYSMNARVAFYTGNGDGTFQTAGEIEFAQFTSLAAGTFKGKSVLGIAADDNGSLAIWPQWPVVELASASLPDFLFTSLVNQSHQLECLYAGDDNYAQSVSSPISVSYPMALSPVFSVPPGKYPPGISVTITAPSLGTNIYYTTDGSSPTMNSTLYTDAITVSSPVTIKAIAVGAAYMDSDVAVATYSTQTHVPEPAITPASGAYSSSQTVTITDSQSGATIYYTIDGTVPTVNSPVYRGQFTVSADTTVTAIAAIPGYQNSPPAWSAYSFGPVDSVAQLTITGSNPYRMSCSVTGRLIADVPGPTGIVAFTDTTTEQTLGSASLGSPTVALYSSVALWGGSVAQTTSPVVTGDFSGDGTPDLATLSGNSVIVNRGNGDGSFQTPGIVSPVNISGIWTDSGISLGNGILNLAAGDAGNSSICVGDGVPPGTSIGDRSDYGSTSSGSLISFGVINVNGTFQSASYPPPDSAQIKGMVAGFFNNDAHLDLAFAYGAEIFVLLGNGDGTFQFSYSESSPPGDSSDGSANLGLASGSTASGLTQNINVDPGTVATHQFQCVYSGDSNYRSSASALISESYRQLTQPVFSLKVGQFTGPQTVSISGSDAHASYYYTTDGSIPTTSGLSQ